MADSLDMTIGPEVGDVSDHRLPFRYRDGSDLPDFADQRASLARVKA